MLDGTSVSAPGPLNSPNSQFTIDTPSPFRTVTQNQQPHIGPLVARDASMEAMMVRLGGSVPPSALLLPIVLRERVVAHS